MSIYEKALESLANYKATKHVPASYDSELLDQLVALGDEYQSEIDFAQNQLDEIEAFMIALEKRK